MLSQRSLKRIDGLYFFALWIVLGILVASATFEIIHLFNRSQPGFRTPMLIIIEFGAAIWLTRLALIGYNDLAEFVRVENKCYVELSVTFVALLIGFSLAIGAASAGFVRFYFTDFVMLPKLPLHVATVMALKVIVLTTILLFSGSAMAWLVTLPKPKRSPR